MNMGCRLGFTVGHVREHASSVCFCTCVDDWHYATVVPLVLVIFHLLCDGFSIESVMIVVFVVLRGTGFDSLPERLLLLFSALPRFLGHQQM